MNKGLTRILHDFKKHPWLHFISVTTIAISLFILGIFFLGYENINTLAEKASPQIVGSLYLKENLSDAQIQQIKEKILSTEQVLKVTFKSKQTVLQDLQSFLGNKNYETIPGGELFPDILEITLKNEMEDTQKDILKGFLTAIPEIVEVDFSEDWLYQYKKFQRFLKIAGIILFVGILLGCSFIISNFMGMRHQARRQEIDIIRLMGANRGFLLTPFLWEGILEGLLGAAIAIPLLYLFKTFGAAAVSMQWTSLIGFKDISFLGFQEMLMLSSLGIVMAFLGSLTVFLRLKEKRFT
jgi:cell division transport system permease protein